MEDGPGNSRHYPFLTDAVTEDGGTGYSGGLAAYLTLRLVDQIASDDRSKGLDYQIKATREFLEDVYPQTTEALLLKEVVEGAAAAAPMESGGLGHVISPVCRYARYLEQEGWLEQALDVVETGLALGGDDEAAMTVWRGNLLLQLARPIEAMFAFKDGLAKAQVSGDEHHALFARLGWGRALIAQNQDAAAAEMLDEVRTTAESVGDNLVEGEACCCLGEIALREKRLPEAKELLHGGLTLLSNCPDAAFFMLGLGVQLKNLQSYDSAERVLNEVYSSCEIPRIRTEAAIHMIHVVALCDDQLGFKRWCAQADGDVAPSLEVLRELAIGRGEAHFGRSKVAAQHIRKARRIAAANDLERLQVEAEEVLRGLGDRTTT